MHAFCDETKEMLVYADGSDLNVNAVLVQAVYDSQERNTAEAATFLVSTTLSQQTSNK